MKKDAYYFSHDSNARNDVKCLHLRKVLGWEGYGIYWALIEKLREENEHRIPLKNVPLISFEFNISEEKINSVINLFDLFVIENDAFFSARLLRSMEEYKSTKTRLSEAGKRGVQARLNQGLNNASTGFKQLKERKVKESKEKERKRNKGFLPPSVFEVIEYFKEKGYTEDSARKAFEFYNVANWTDSNGKEVKNWKQKMLSVWMKEENKQVANERKMVM
jgi:hypothetical protein